MQFVTPIRTKIGGLVSIPARGRRCPILVLLCALMLVDPASTLGQSTQARPVPTPTPEWTDFNAHDPGIVLFADGSAKQAVTLLISNPAASAPPCHFNGVVRVADLTPPFGSGLRELVFEPNLAPGQAVAIGNIRPPLLDEWSSPTTGQPRILEIHIEAADSASRSCRLRVGALGYELESEATQFMIDLHRFTAGVEKTFAPPGRAGSLPVGFVGGNAGQSAYLVLADNGASSPNPRCDLTGRVSAETLPAYEAEDSTSPGFSSRNSWPVKWEGPASQKVAVVRIPFQELGATAKERVDALLSVHFDRPPPTACLKGVSATLQIVDRETGATRAWSGKNLLDHELFHVMR